MVWQLFDKGIPEDADASGAAPSIKVGLDTRSVWAASWVVVSVLILVGLLKFVFAGGSSVFWVIAMAFFFALAMEPLVSRLSKRMSRSLATGVTMGGLALFFVIFFAIFGQMLATQLASLVTGTPDVLANVLEWANGKFGTHFSSDTILSDLGVSTDDLTSYATRLAGGVLGVVGNTLGFLLNAFAFVFVGYFLSAGLPRLRQWLAGLLRPRLQVVFLTTWELTVIKVGGYVASRLTLAVISGVAHALFMLAIGMDYWLPLGIWTGLVAQFVPNVGTYIAIALPVVVGAASKDPKDGLWVLLFAIAYQQVENLSFEPRISARAVDVHPAVSFLSALLGAQLFGIAGATLGVPVAATVMALLEIYSHRYEISPDTETLAAALVSKQERSEAIASGNPDAVRAVAGETADAAAAPGPTRTAEEP